MPYKTSAKVSCEECRKKRKAESGRRAAEKVRRAKGIAQVKGTDSTCCACGASYVRATIKDRFCAPCRPEAARGRARARINRLSRERGAPELGESAACKHCKAAFARLAPRQVYCSSCRALQAANQLPHLIAARKRYWLGVLRPRLQSDPEFAAHASRLAFESRGRRKLNPAFTINERMSAAIRGSLKSGKNGSSWESLVGYQVADLMRHLERQFLKGMSWETRHLWEIDHIIALSSFSYDSPDDPEFRAAWALSNLRPLWREQNNAKRDKRIFLL